MEAALQDIRYAFRGFHRNPVFAISILLTLALGIGTTTAVFSVVDRYRFGLCRMRMRVGSYPWAWCNRWSTRSSSWDAPLWSGGIVRSLLLLLRARAPASTIAT